MQISYDQLCKLRLTQEEWEHLQHMTYGDYDPCLIPESITDIAILAGLVRRDMDGIPRLTEVGEEALRLMASLYPEEREAVYWENYGKWLMNGFPMGSVPFSPAPASQEGQDLR